MSNSTGTGTIDSHQRHATLLPAFGLSQPAPSHRLHSGPTHAMHGKCLGCQMSLPSLTRTLPTQKMREAHHNQTCPAQSCPGRQQPGYRPAPKSSTQREFADHPVMASYCSELQEASLLLQESPSRPDVLVQQGIWWLQVRLVTCEKFVQSPLNHSGCCRSIAHPACDDFQSGPAAWCTG